MAWLIKVVPDSRQSVCEESPYIYITEDCDDGVAEARNRGD